MVLGTPINRRNLVLIHIFFIAIRRIGAYEMEARWGHAATYIPSPPGIIIQGGKTDPSSLYSYTSAPNSGDTIFLPLNNGFSTSSPPYIPLQIASSPAYAWHTFSTLSGNSGQYELMSFGGDGGTSEAVQTLPNSMWTGAIDISNAKAEYTQALSGESNQPMRRIHHSAASDGSGKVYITGGLKADGSGATFSDVYVYDSATSTFSTLPSLPEARYHHNSLLLDNGTLLVMGGTTTSQFTGNAAVNQLSDLYTLDTTSGMSVWEERSVGGSAPIGRRGASLVMSQDGSKAFLLGGGDAGLTTVYSDGWVLDLHTASWSKVSDGEGGAGPRFDHSAVSMGNDQVIVFGGYGVGEPADPTLYIWDMAKSEWTNSVVTTTNPSPSESAPGSTSSGTMTVITTAKSSSSFSVSASRTSNDATGIETGTEPTNDPTDSSLPEAAGGPLSASAKIALAVSAVVIAAVILGGLIHRYRRRNRRKALLGDAAGNGPPGHPPRPYGSREKGGPGFIDDSVDQGSGPGEKSPMIGLGMGAIGAIGASLASISSKLGRRRVDPYAELHDSGQVIPAGPPTRRSTRRSGRGIRLVQSDSSTSSMNAPVGGTGRQRSSSDLRDSRLDMLHDEDSRRFAAIPEEDWVMTTEDGNARWTSARSILREHQESDPFDDVDEEEDDDDDDVAVLLPPLQDGPLPTPHASRPDLDPFSYSRRSSQYLSPFDDSEISSLSPPRPLSGYPEMSLPRSARSGLTGSVSDAEEGVIHHAHIASHTSASVLSPVEPYEPIKRSESFFRRMVAGGITSLLSRNTSQRGTVRVLDIRDPRPAPALWPIKSRDELGEGPSYPPSAFRGLEAGQSNHGQGPSLSSLQSAKSMRDMVIVQREPTDSTEEEGMIGSSSPVLDEDDSASGSPNQILGNGRGEEQKRGMIAPASPEVYSHHRHGLTAVTDSSQSISGPSRMVSHTARSGGAGGETPGSIVFNGADFASPSVPIVDFGETPTLGLSRPALTPIQVPEPATPPKKQTPKATPPGPLDPFQDQAAAATPRSSAPPSGSPVPSPLVSHRRPVREVVNSINKRGGVLPLAFTSPTSVYSPSSPAATPRTGRRPMTMYEAVKRERLLVANPDTTRRDWDRKSDS